MDTEDEIRARRRHRLYVALAFALVRTPSGRQPREAMIVRRWLATWAGIGAIAEGMAHQEFDLTLQRQGDAWKASFYWRDARSAVWEARREMAAQPWDAVLAAAWRALNATPQHVVRNWALVDDSPH